MPRSLRAFARLVVGAREDKRNFGPLATGDELVRVARVEAGGNEDVEFEVTVRREGRDGDFIEFADGSTPIVATMAKGKIRQNQKVRFKLIQPVGSINFRRWRHDADNLDVDVGVGVGDVDRRNRRTARDANRGHLPRYCEDFVAWGVPDLPTVNEVLLDDGPDVVFASASRAQARRDLEARRDHFVRKLGVGVSSGRITVTRQGFASLRPQYDVQRLSVMNAKAIFDPLQSYVMSVVREHDGVSSQAAAACHVPVDENVAANERGRAALEIAERLAATVATWEASLVDVIEFSNARARNTSPWCPSHA